MGNNSYEIDRLLMIEIVLMAFKITFIAE